MTNTMWEERLQQQTEGIYVFLHSLFFFKYSTEVCDARVKMKGLQWSGGNVCAKTNNAIIMGFGII